MDRLAFCTDPIRRLLGAMALGWLCAAPLMAAQVQTNDDSSAPVSRIVSRSAGADHQHGSCFHSSFGPVRRQWQVVPGSGGEQGTARATLTLTRGGWPQTGMDRRGTRIAMPLDRLRGREAGGDIFGPCKASLCAGQEHVLFGDRRVADTGARSEHPGEVNRMSPAFQVICQDAGAGGYEAFPDVVRLHDGDLLCVFYAGYGHVSHPTPDLPRGARVCAVRSTDNGRSWGPAEVVADTPWDDRDPHVCQLADGTVICNWFTYYAGATPRPGNPNPYKEIWLARSSDSGHTWTEPELIRSTADDHWGCSAPIRQMPDGTLIMPIYKELPDPLRVWSAVITSTDGGLTWGAPVMVDPENDDNDEPDIIRLPNGRLLCVMRSNRGDCTMWQSWSEDGAKSWSTSTPVGFPGHAPYLLRTSQGILLCAHRLPGTSVHYSLDDGQSWSENVLVDSVGGAYPSMAELPDGRVLIVYYEEGEGSSIRARFFRVSPDGIVFEE